MLITVSLGTVPVTMITEKSELRFVGFKGRNVVGTWRF